MVLSDYEKKVLAEVSKEESWEHVKWFASIGEKLSGSPEFEKSVDYVLDKLKSYNVDATAPEFQAYLSFPKTFDAQLKVLEPEKKAIECIAYAQIKSTSPEGIEGELVYVSQGGLEDYKGKNVRNKITLAELSYAPPRPWKNYVAGVLKGAIGQVQINYTSPRPKVYGRGTVKSIWGNPTPETIDDVGRIPVVNISWEDGEYLKKLLDKGPVKVWMRAEATREWMRTRQPIGTIKGKEPKFVLVGSHMDAWGAAVTCNAVGNASTLEIARVIGKFKSHLRRGVEFLWYTGHETGIMDGSTWYVDNFWDKLHKNCIANFNNDSTGMLYATAGYSGGGDPILSEFLMSTMKELAEEEGVPFMGGRGRSIRYMPSKVGDASFLGLGIPSGSARATSSPEVISKLPYRYNWWYHSDYDTLDKADAEALYMANKAQVFAVFRLCTLPVLPYKVTPVTDWMIETLKEHNQKAKATLDLTDLVEKAETFKKVAVKLDEALGWLSEKCGDEAEAQRLKEKIQAANDGLLKICRILNPVNYTLHGKYGQDNYGAEYVRPIPQLQPVAELPTLNPDTSDYKALRTKLVKVRNIVSDALEDTMWFTEYTTEKIKIS